MKWTRRELSIDMVIRGTIKNNQITFFPCFIFTYNRGWFLLWGVHIYPNSYISNQSQA